MTRLVNDPAEFAADMLAGFVDAYAGHVRAVPGGVVRAVRPRPGKVAVVVGGGSGHYPAFCGIVGPGFADGAVVGNVFTSPSAADAVSVGTAASTGGGVLLTTGNYAGDVMNFRQAVDRLASAGIEATYVAVTDDLASAAPDELDKRRGIAGDVVVFKVAAAAAEAGHDLAGVEQLALRANDRTRTLGVAFSGCTLPGQDQPLFTVPDGRLSLGMGIHGEAGISEVDLPTAAELAELLVERILAEAPAGADGRAAVLLNGLGSTKYEELFVVWGAVAPRLRAAGLDLVAPEVGELVTSLDMAGCSLTVSWLDDDLTPLWTAPADTPAFRRGSPDRSVSSVTSEPASPSVSPAGPEVGTGAVVRDDPAAGTDDAGRKVAGAVAAALAAVRDVAVAEEQAWGRLDAVAGDGDHGRGMVNGATAAAAAAETAASAGHGARSTLRLAADAWAAKAGGTSGVLWGALLEQVADSLGDRGRPDAVAVAGGVRAGYDAVVRLGGAAPGDKTLLDALGPFVDELERRIRSGDDLSTAWRAAAGTALAAAEATADLLPKVGRARPLAERSRGTPDPGAVSLAACASAVADVLGREGDR